MKPLKMMLYLTWKDAHNVVLREKCRVQSVFVQQMCIHVSISMNIWKGVHQNVNSWHH